MVGHLQDPRTGGALGTIEYSALLVNEQEYVLEQVVRFRIIPEDLVPDRPHQSRVTMKETSQRFLISIADPSHQGFIWNFDAVD